MINTHDYVTLLAEVLIPEAATVENITLGQELSTHLITYNVTDNNILKMILYSFDNTPFSTNETEMLQITLGNILKDDSIKIQNITATDTYSQRYAIRAENNYGGIGFVIEDNDGIYRVYDINGNCIMTTFQEEDLNKLENGIYIINGKKVLISK